MLTYKLCCIALHVCLVFSDNVNVESKTCQNCYFVLNVQKDTVREHIMYITEVKQIGLVPLFVFNGLVKKIQFNSISILIFLIFSLLVNNSTALHTQGLICCLRNPGERK